MSISGTPWKYEEKGFTIDLSHLSTSNFYPCMFAGLSTGFVDTDVMSQTFMHCQIVSRGRTSSGLFYHNMLDFTMSAAGGRAVPKTINIHKYACYDSYDTAKKTIGCIGSADVSYVRKEGAICVWLRGGIIYDIVSNFVPTSYESGYEDTESYGFSATVGTTLHGGTNSNMTIDWTPPDHEEPSGVLGAWPVGSIFMSVSHTTATQVRNALGGGTWVAWGTGRVPVSVDTSQTEFNTVEKTGGEKTHKLTVSEMPKHSHGLKRNVPYGIPYNDTGGAPANAGGGVYYGESYNPLTVEDTGGDGSHNNLQPYITCYFWKRTA